MLNTDKRTLKPGAICEMRSVCTMFRVLYLAEFNVVQDFGYFDSSHCELLAIHVNQGFGDGADEEGDLEGTVVKGVLQFRGFRIKFLNP